MSTETSLDEKWGAGRRDGQSRILTWLTGCREFARVWRLCGGLVVVRTRARARANRGNLDAQRARGDDWSDAAVFASSAACCWQQAGDGVFIVRLSLATDIERLASFIGIGSRLPLAGHLSSLPSKVVLPETER
ncbi:hypothetical protein PQR02_07645 [Paraburkholderia sediminicola]|uniref:Uncharacterized protein n=1 Tax=Paraburkholderia rhynchosiae TaxID=487049 RepID=A0ACC7N4N8_9BURK